MLLNGEFARENFARIMESAFPNLSYFSFHDFILSRPLRARLISRVRTSHELQRSGNQSCFRGVISSEWVNQAFIIPDWMAISVVDNNSWLRCCGSTTLPIPRSRLTISATTSAVDFRREWARPFYCTQTSRIQQKLISTSSSYFVVFQCCSEITYD